MSTGDKSSSVTTSYKIVLCYKTIPMLQNCPHATVTMLQNYSHATKLPFQATKLSPCCKTALPCYETVPKLQNWLLFTKLSPHYKTVHMLQSNKTALPRYKAVSKLQSCLQAIKFSMLQSRPQATKSSPYNKTGDQVMMNNL